MIKNLVPHCNFNLVVLQQMSNGCEEEGVGGRGGGGGGGSRFSQFFRRESPSPKLPLQSQESRYSSTQDEMFNSMINGRSS